MDVITSYSIHYTKLYEWQNEARKEIISAILNAERCQSYKSNFFNRFLMLVGATTASLGFLGAIVAYGQTGRSLVAAVCVALGIIFIVMGFEWLTIVITSYSIHYTKLYEMSKSLSI